MQDFRPNIECMTVKNGLLILKCLDSNKTNEKKFEKDLSKRFENIYQLCDGGIDKFCLILQKGVSR